MMITPAIAGCGFRQISFPTMTALAATNTAGATG